MSEGKSVYEYQAVVADNYIVVWRISFDPTGGRLSLAIDENQQNVVQKWKKDNTVKEIKSFE
jgi:hypothetical protein